MDNYLRKIRIQNFRSLKNIDFAPSPVNCFFGPNGSGKSSFLDALLYVKDTLVRSFGHANDIRNSALNLLWAKAETDEFCQILIENDLKSFFIRTDFKNVHHRGFPSEPAKTSELFDDNLIKAYIPLNELQVNTKDNSDKAKMLLDSLKSISYYNLREQDILRLKKYGSEQNSSTFLLEKSKNLFSLVRNLRDFSPKDVRDGYSKTRFEQIEFFMKEAFPEFESLLLLSKGDRETECKFYVKCFNDPFDAYDMADGYIQLLILLTALFTKPQNEFSLLLFDEPETALHPHAIKVFADAVRFASENYNKQVFIATHSPMLISQFKEDELVVMSKGKEGETTLTKLSEIESMKDLIEEYAPGSLYMLELIGSQSEID